MNRRILIADDDKEIANLVGIYLANEGFDIAKAHTGPEALEQCGQERIDLMVLDIMMPGMDGMEVCRRVRATQNFPILMLSAKAEDMDKILGLMTGADDYMVKPFNPLELVARVKSLLRRSFTLNTRAQPQADEDVIHADPLVMNRATHNVAVDGRKISLTSIEFDILYLLASHPGRVFGAEEIFSRVWKERYFESNNTVMVHISKLRDKVEEGGAKLIHTVWGVGYKFEN